MAIRAHDNIYANHVVLKHTGQHIFWVFESKTKMILVQNQHEKVTCELTFFQHAVHHSSPPCSRRPGAERDTAAAGGGGGVGGPVLAAGAVLLASSMAATLF